MSQSNPIQVTVIRNLVSKLKSKNNTKYVDIIKDTSALHKNRLGQKNYALLSEVFGLPCATTASQRVTTTRLEPGFNLEAIKRATLEFQGFPVIECSDEELCDLLNPGLIKVES